MAEKNKLKAILSIYKRYNIIKINTEERPMKSITYIRHANAEGGTFSNDFARNLSQTGRDDAFNMANIFSNENERPDFVLSSSAVRAVQTFGYFADRLAIPKENIIYDKALYMGNCRTLCRAIEAVPEQHNNLMIVGHNPTISEMICRYGDVTIGNVPPCTIVKINYDADTWSLALDSAAKVAAVYYSSKFRTK